MELISVIIPTYNRAHTIKRSVTSVLNQTYKSIEIIVVDDGSLDETRDVLDNLIKENKIIYHYQDNGGASSARNKGITLANGNFIAFQDSDDEWVLDKLEKQMNLFQKTGAKVIYSDMQRIDISGKESYFLSPSVEDLGGLINPRTNDYSTCCIGIGSCLIHKDCFENCGVFDELYPALEDLELLLRISQKYTFEKIEVPLVRYYETEGVSSNTLNQIEARKKLLEAYILPNFDKNNIAYREQCRLISFMYSNIGLPKESKEYAFKMVNSNKSKLNKYTLYYAIIKLNLLEPLRNIRRNIIRWKES